MDEDVVPEIESNRRVYGQSLYSFSCSIPANIIKLSKDVWDWFGNPIDLVQHLLRNVLLRLKDEDLVWKMGLGFRPAR
jgi:hypothetical protein